MHKLLKRQLEKHLGTNYVQSVELQAFIKSVDQAYITSDNRYQNLERTLEVSSDEAFTELTNFRTAIDEAAMVVHFSRNGILTYANNSFCTLTGFIPEELKGKRISELLQKNEIELLNSALVKLGNGFSWKGETSFTGKFGKSIWLHCTVVPLTNPGGKIVRYMGIMIDITARKIFEEEIIISEKKYKHVINNIKEILFQTDLDGDWTFLNQAWTEITGIHVIETMGSRIMDYIHEDDKCFVEEKLKAIKNNEIEFCNCIARFKTSLDQYRTFDVFAKMIKDEKGKIIGISGTMNDVTEKHRNEELLIKSYSFQRAILDSAKQAIISTDIKGKIRTFNSGAEQMLGFQAEDVVGQTDISKIFDPKGIISNQKTNLHNAQESVWFNGLVHESTGASAEEHEHHLLHRNNKIIPVMLSLTAIKDHVGNISGYLFIANDISKRKIAEDENNKLNKILEETPDYVVYYDLKNKPLYSNKAYKEIRFNNDKETEHPLHPAWADIIIRKKAIPYAMDKGSWKGETAILDRDGNEIPVLQLIIQHKDENGHPLFRSSVMRDITQRKQYEHRLLHSEKRNRDLINYSQGVICTHDLSGKILSINPAGYELIGYTLEELVGNSISDFIVEEHREQFRNEYLNGFGSGRIAEGVLALKHKDGHKVQLLYKNYKVEENNGQTYIIGFAQDVTERLKAENDLKLAKQTAEESSKAKELFLANMSHEIRTPMNGIVGLTNLLLRSSLNEKQQQYAISVKQSSENLLVIINDILDFSKIHAGKLEINKAAFDLSDLLYNIRQTFQLEAQQKGIQLTTTLDDNVHPIVLGDQVRMNQILVNLLSNALKFTQKGNVTISISLINDGEETSRLKFSVKDSGIGIAEDKLKKVFHSFTQAHTDTNRNYGGTGLGLSIVKNLLELMGSQIKVKSTAGQGSEFYFEINLDKGSRILIQKIEESEINLTGKLNGIKILLVEDNKVNQLFAYELLSDWGAIIDIADDGRKAIDFLEKQNYDIILMDIQMPVMNGIEATLFIRNELNGLKSEIPIIAMTANAMKGEDAKFLKAGMNDVVFKPFESLELFTKISKQLNSNRPVENQKDDITNQYRLKPQNPNHKREVDIPLPLLEYANLEILKSFSRGKISFMLKMIGVIIDTVPSTVIELDKAIQAKDWENINRYAHKLIPNMNMTGNILLEQQIKTIENIAMLPHEQGSIFKIWKELQPLIDNVLGDLKLAYKFYLDRSVTS